MDVTLQNLNDVIRSIGRGVIFYAQRWDPGLGAALALTHLADTEGDITLTTNSEISALTLPEITGPAIHEADLTGENPVLEAPLFLANPSLRSIVTPVGSAHAGNERRRAPAEFTLVIFPENLFMDASGAGSPKARVISCDAGAWKFNGVALDAARLVMLGQSAWLWRCYFERPPIEWKGGAGNERKTILKVTARVMHHPDMPDGHHLFTQGNPIAANIDLEGGS